MARLLRTDLPDDVWDRLNAEAAEHGVKIGVYVKRLIVARDARRVSRNQPVSEPSDTGSNEREG